MKLEDCLVVDSNFQVEHGSEKYPEPSGITQTYENMASDTDVQTYCDIVDAEVDSTVHPTVRPTSIIPSHHLEFISIQRQ